VIVTAVNIDTPNESGITSLGLAVSHQMLPQVKILLENEASVSIKDINGENILMLAIRSDELRKNAQLQEAQEVMSLGSKKKVAEQMDKTTLQDLRKTE